MPKTNVLFAMVLALCATGCVAELGGTEDELATEQAALTAPAVEDGAGTPVAAPPSSDSLLLQEATQMESRRFQTLSNASKARNDISLNAIRNMK